MSSAESSPTANTVDRSISAGAPERARSPADAREACACSTCLTEVSASPSSNDGTPSIRNTALSTPAAAAASAARSVQTASTSKPTNSTSGRILAQATVYSPFPQPKSSTTCENACSRCFPPGAHAAQRPAQATPSQQIQSLHSRKRFANENPLCNLEAAERMPSPFARVTSSAPYT